MLSSYNDTSSKLFSVTINVALDLSVNTIKRDQCSSGFHLTSTCLCTANNPKVFALLKTNPQGRGRPARGPCENWFIQATRKI